MSGKIKVLVVEPMRPCEVREIPDTLDAMRQIVGGDIEAVTSIRYASAIVCNENGKLLDLPYNRPLLDEGGLLPLDILHGTFFIAGMSGEHFVSLTDEQIQRYKDLYDNVMALTAERPENQAEIGPDTATPSYALPQCQEQPQAHQGQKSMEKSGRPQPDAGGTGMSGDTPVNIAGVLAFPNDADGGMIRFIDSDYNTLFHVPDGGNIILTAFDDGRRVLPCRYIDASHALIGGETFHICQFAEIQERAGAVYAPEHPRPGDVLDTYTIYQIKDIRAVPYAFRGYEEAKGKLKMAHYARAYRGVLAPSVTLDELYEKHNRDSRPFGHRIHSMSMSDVVVVNRGGTEKAYYVDTVGFQEAKRFLNPPVRKRKPPRQER